MTLSSVRRRRRLSPRLFRAAAAASVESLDRRILLAAPAEVLAWHNDGRSTGNNLAETILTPANVNASTFGLLARATLDGQVYAQPLLKANVNVTRGSSLGIHNVVYAATLHDSLYALDAETGAVLWKDSFTNITDPTNLTPTAGVRTVPAGSSSSTPAQPYDALVNTSDVGPELGIIATPVIDPAANVIYVVANTQESRVGATPSVNGTEVHFVQRLWAINLSNGSVAVAAAADPKVVPNAALIPASGGKTIGDVWKTDVPTFNNYTNYKYYAGPWVKGTGQNGTYSAATGDSAPLDGWVVNSLDTATPWGSAGKTPMQTGNLVFNALLQMGRPGLTLLNGNLYMAFASHGDKGPYYGWVLGFSTANLTNTAAFLTAPTFEPFSEVSGNNGTSDAQGGVWMSGAAIGTDGTYLYLTVGNGAFDIKSVNFSNNYFTTDSGNTVLLPLDNDYGDCVLKLAVDASANQSTLDLTSPPTTFNPAGQNVNGYGLKVTDFFAPSNALRLNAIDADLGSGGVLLLPDNITSTVPGHAGHHMLVTGGKEGRIYLIDRENLGGYNTAYPNPLSGGQPDPNVNGPDPSPYDRVLGEYSVNGTDNQSNQFYSTASYFSDGTTPAFYVALAGKPNWKFNVSSFQAAQSPPGSANINVPNAQTTVSFPRRGSTSTISANGTANGIFWNLSTNLASTDQLMAFGATLGTAIYSSQTNAADNLPGSTSLSTGVKFSLPMEANGFVYAGTGGGSGSTGSTIGSIAFYGLKSPALHAPTALTAQPTSTTAVHLTWSRTGGDQESLVQVERSSDGTNWSLVHNLANGSTSYDDTGLSPATKYFYRVTELYGAGSSAHSATATVITSPSVSNVTSTATNGTYDVGGSIPITVTFTEAVTVSGTPTLALGDGGVASFTGGSGTPTLTFTYTVGAGQNTSDLDYNSATALALNGGTIRDAGSVDANLTLPAPGATGSLGANKSLVVDTSPPTAVDGAQTPAAGTTFLDFTVTYADSASGVDTSTFGDGDITVTGPAGFSKTATYVSSSSDVVTYRVAAPGGKWDVTDNGTYTINQNAGEVKDLAGHARAAGAIGTFVASVAFAYVSGGVLFTDFDGAAHPITLATSGSNVTAAQNGSLLSFASGSFSSALVTGTSGNDALVVNGVITQPLTFNGGGGNDGVTVNAGGAVAFGEDAQHVGSLTLSGGSATLVAGGSKVLVVNSLAVSGGGQLNLQDNDLIVSAGTVGSWNGSAYTGVSGLVAAGAIRSSVASLNYTTLGVAGASDALGIPAAQTSTFDGQTVAGSAVLVKYTYVGDANLDGVVNIDDYTQIDSSVSAGGVLKGWFNGDFNLDGTVDIDDYTVIDSVIGIQGQPL